jgi:hypothetical protein
MVRRRPAFVVVALSLSSLACSPAVTVSMRPPPTAAPAMDEGRRAVDAYFRVFNSGDPKAMLAFRHDYWSHRVPWLADA